MSSDYLRGIEVVQHPPGAMQGLADGWNTTERREADEQLEALAVAAVWRSTYFYMRHGAGCGDQGHEAAVKEANKITARVRKVLGYSTTHPIKV